MGEGTAEPAAAAAVVAGRRAADSIRPDPVEESRGVWGGRDAPSGAASWKKWERGWWRHMICFSAARHGQQRARERV
jgi:hypothetical protein